MALRSNSKEWRRSRSTSFIDLVSSTPPSSPRRAQSVARRAARFPFRFRLSATFFLALCSLIAIGLLLRSNNGASAQSSTTNLQHDLAHPNFDFDTHLAEELAQREESEREEERRREHTGEATGDGNDDEDTNSENEEDEGEDSALPPVWTEVESQQTQLNSLSSTLPFLPYSCDTCSTTSTLYPVARTCAKYQSPPTKPYPKSPTSPVLNPDVLDRSVMFAGTGADVRRVLKRAMKSSLYGMKREREGKEGDLTKFEDEEPFRILILGGSVSNCRGVDPKTTCWHAGLLRWFQQALPMEGDRDLVPDTPSLLVTLDPSGPTRLDTERVKRAYIPSPPPSPPAPLLSDSPSPFPPLRPTTRPLVKRAAGKSKKKKKKKKGKKKTITSRQRPSTRLINGSKSATGSSFFAYCYEEEMNLRGKNLELGKGPDLIILEYGVNDVYPHDEVATRDFEKHLRALRSLPSRPAVIALEAASLLLASTTSFTSNAEYLHLPAAQFYDVPVLSAKQALFGPHSPFTPSSSLKMQDLFLPDQHHPNDRGHEFLSDILVSYLEQQACIAQKEVLETTNARLLSTFATIPSDAVVEPETDIVRRKEEVVRPLPTRSLFTPLPLKEKDNVEWVMPQPRCIQVGNSKTTIEPIHNSGWEKYGWARDKQYLIADKPGSTVSYEIEVGIGGTIMADWLRSRFYDLGDVSVFLDDDRSKAVTLAGYWNLGWSIGVPTEIFSEVTAGLHKVTFEILPASKSSHPGKKTNFRLIGLIST